MSSELPLTSGVSSSLSTGVYSKIVSYLGDNLSYLTYYNNGTGGFDSITFGEIEVSYDNDFAAHGTHTYITS